MANDIHSSEIAHLLKVAGIRAEAAAREWLEQNGSNIETIRPRHPQSEGRVDCGCPHWV